MPNSYFNQAYQRFFFLYGHTDDEFCPASLGILNLEEVLHQHLQQLGYQRMVFYSGRQKIYFLEPQSFEASRPSVLPAAALKTKKKRRSKMCSGPLGHKSIRAAEAPLVDREDVALPLDAYGSLQMGRMNDLEVVGFIHRCMQDETHKTAVIFADGLDFILHFEHVAQRQMAGVLNSVSKLPSTNHNLCLFILPQTELQNLRFSLEKHGWQFLLPHFFDQDNTPSDKVISIGSPRQDEIAHLLHHWRLKKGLDTAWLELDAAILPLTRKLCATGKSLKSLSYQIQTYASLDQAALQRLCGHYDEKPALERLRAMKGLEIVMDKIQRLVLRHQQTQEPLPRVHTEQASVLRLLPTTVKHYARPVNLHLVLQGNPGTGKTTVAELIAEIYRDAGLLELGHIVKASREDLVAGYVGQTAIQTAQKVADAMGGVLFIDEAYRLIEGDDADFGREAIETIMEAMSNRLGEFAVIIAGYPESIDAFLNSNPGLRRRFSESNTLHIPDYQPEILQHIFEAAVKDTGLQLDTALQAHLTDFFANWYAQRDRATFGNAGEVLNLLQAMDENRVIRGAKQAVLTIEDVPTDKQGFLQARQPDNLDEILQVLDHLTGLERVKHTIRSLVNRIKIQKRRDENVELIPGHYAFVGNPGTGKTTVARLMGQIFYALNLLQRGHLVEVGRADLVASIGELQSSAQKTQAVVQRSLDGVLFIDEAYQLVQSPHDETGKEALETLLMAMENQRTRLCLIAAGYPQNIKRFLQANPGMPSRFAQTIMFADYNAQEMVEIFQHLVQRHKLHLGAGVEAAVLVIFQRWEREKQAYFGNAREIRKFFDALCLAQNNRLVAEDVMDKTLLYRLEVADVKAVALEEV